MTNANHTTKEQILQANRKILQENCELYNKNQQLAADNEKLQLSMKVSESNLHLMTNDHNAVVKIAQDRMKLIAELQSDRQTEFTNIMLELGVVVGYEPTIDDVLKRAKEVMAANESLHSKNVELEAKVTELDKSKTWEFLYSQCLFTLSGLKAHFQKFHEMESHNEAYRYMITALNGEGVSNLSQLQEHFIRFHELEAKLQTKNTLSTELDRLRANEINAEKQTAKIAELKNELDSLSFDKQEGLNNIMERLTGKEQAEDVELDEVLEAARDLQFDLIQKDINFENLEKGIEKVKTDFEARGEIIVNIRNDHEREISRLKTVILTLESVVKIALGRE